MQTLSFTGTLDVGADAPFNFYGHMPFPSGEIGPVDQSTGERTVVLSDPAAVFVIDGVALDVTEHEIRLGNNLDFMGQGFLILDTLAFTATGNGFGVRVGVATLDLGTFTGPDLPVAPLSLDEDFESTFNTELFVPELFDGRQIGQTTRFFLSEGEIGVGLSEAAAREVAYLYEAGLDRDGEIDTAGLNFWIDAREDGLSRRNLSEAFLASDEFANAFGAPETLSDRALVEQLYQNVLDRAGEGAGTDFWTAQLGRADFDRTDLLIAFAASPENVAGSPVVEDLVEIAPGSWDFL
ncbi:MAG: DUF4214 domain-containing protein [Pseudomonadota bacterium]